MLIGDNSRVRKNYFLSNNTKISKIKNTHIVSAIGLVWNPWLVSQKPRTSWEFHLSYYDLTVIQWIMLCHKNRVTTRVITVWCLHVTSLTTSVSMRFLTEILLTSKAIKFHLKDPMINRILHSWSFHMKFMKLAKNWFHKFHVK